LVLTGPWVTVRVLTYLKTTPDGEPPDGEPLAGVRERDSTAVVRFGGWSETAGIASST
jgi:hypothetical protein